MKTLFSLFIFLTFSLTSFCQLEFSTGYAVNKNLADGLPIQIGYDFRLINRLYTKSQIGFKYLHHYNDFVGATINVSIWEFHQTLSYEIIKKGKYILKPNLGVNYRYYHWNGEMEEPLNTMPIRAWSIEFRDRNFLRLVSTSLGAKNEYQVNNLGFSIQLQNQFKLSEKVWLHITPFIEPDYDRTQNTGGCYVGVTLKSL